MIRINNNHIKLMFLTFILLATSCGDDRNLPFELYDRPVKSEHYFTYNELLDDPARPGEVVIVNLEAQNQPYKLSIEEDLYDTGNESNRGTDIIPYFIPRSENFRIRVDSDQDINLKIFRDSGEELTSINPGERREIFLDRGRYNFQLTRNDVYEYVEFADTTFVPIFIQPDMETFNEIGYPGNADYRPQDVFMLVASKSCLECDFSSSDPDSNHTKYADLSNSDLRSTNFRNNIFVRANFYGSNLSYQVLTERDGRQLGETNLSNASFFNCDFRDADISYCQDLSHTSFKGSIMDNCTIEGSYGLFISFEDCTMAEANLSRLLSRDNNFAGTNLRDAEIVGAVIRRSEFNWTFMKNAVFDLSDMSDSKIENTWISGVSIKGTNLCGSQILNLIFEDDALPVVTDTTSQCDSLFIVDRE